MGSAEAMLEDFCFLLGRGSQKGPATQTLALLKKKNRKDCNEVESREGNENRNLKALIWFLNLGVGVGG